MLQDVLQNIVSILLSLNTVFVDGYVLNIRDQTRGLGEGNGNYFYFVEDTDSDGFNGLVIEPSDENKHFYLFSEKWKLIISIKCVDRLLIAKRLIGQLILKTPGVPIKINGYSTDSELIFEEETGQKMTQDSDIIRINISIAKGVTTEGLDCLPICEEDCC